MIWVFCYDEFIMGNYENKSVNEIGVIKFKRGINYGWWEVREGR